MQHTEKKAENSKYRSLAAAIEQGNLEQVKELLSPDLLYEIESEGLNLVHIGCNKAHLSVCRYLFQFVIQHGRADMLEARDNFNFTPLHHAVRFGSYELVSALVFALKDRADDAVKKLSKSGKMPIEMLSDKKIFTDQSEDIRSLLEPHMKRNKHPSLDHKLSVNAVLTEYDEDCKADPTLKEDLIFMVKMVNVTRESPFATNTHPNANNNAPDEIDDHIAKMREQIDEEQEAIQASFKKEVERMKSLELTSELISEYVKLDANYARDKNECARRITDKKMLKNCGELANNFLCYAYNEDPDRYVERVRILNANHSLVMMRRDLLADARRPTKRVIFADPLAGTVCLERDCHRKLFFYREHRPNKNPHPFMVAGEIDPDCQFIVLRGDDELKCGATKTHLELIWERKNNLEFRKGFIKACNHEGRNKLHQAAPIKSIMNNRIYFHWLAEMKDDKFVREILQSKNDLKEMPLHLAAYNKDPAVFKLHLDQYRKYFGEDLASVIFGPDLRDDTLIRYISYGKNDGRLEMLLDCFKSERHVIQAIHDQMQDVFFRAINDESEEQVSMLQHHWALFTTREELESEFFNLPASHLMHQSLYEICSKDKKDQNATLKLLQRHPDYQPLIKAFNELSAQKKTDQMRSNSFISMFDSSLNSRKEVLSKLPDTLQFSDVLIPNISLTEIEAIRDELSTLYHNKPVVSNSR